MKFLKRKFTHYSLCYYANDKEIKSDDCIAKINCYNEDQKVEKDLGTVLSTVLTMKFFKDDSEIPPNEVEWYKGDYKSRSKKLREKYGLLWKINLHYPISQFNDIISILRHEGKPFYLIIEDKKDNLKGGLITEGLIDDNEYEYSYEYLE